MVLGRATWPVLTTRRFIATMLTMSTSSSRDAATTMCVVRPTAVGITRPTDRGTCMHYSIRSLPTFSVPLVLIRRLDMETNEFCMTLSTLVVIYRLNAMIVMAMLLIRMLSLCGRTQQARNSSISAGMTWKNLRHSSSIVCSIGPCRTCSVLRTTFRGTFISRVSLVIATEALSLFSRWAKPLLANSMSALEVLATVESIMMDFFP